MPPNNVSNRMILDAVQEVKDDLKTINGRLRDAETDVAGLKQWRHDHVENVSIPLAEEVKALRRRTDMHQKWNSVLTFGEVVITALLTAVGLKPNA